MSFVARKKTDTKKKSPAKKSPVKEREVEEVDEEVAAEAQQAFQNSIIMLPPVEEEEDSGIRSIGLIGDVNEERASEVIYALLSMWRDGIKKPDVDEGKKKTKKDVSELIKLYISTHGGSASDMFAIYDVMRMVKADIPISTIGLGKVMSAGVLLLAAGTKGHRKIGKHCRVMIHSVLAGNEGPIHSLENEMNEIRWTQDRYINALIAETKITPTTMKKLLEKHVNIYLSAEEAVKYGIADEVV